MLEFKIITIFPEYFESPLNTSLLKKARDKGLLDFKIYNLRDFSSDGVVDDRPFGGGTGMVLKIEPIFNAYEKLKEEGQVFIYLTPKGKKFNHELAKEIHSKYKKFLILCGRYEGIDERVIEILKPYEISIGDYVLNGGEAASLVFIEVIARLEKGVVGKEEAVLDDSFSKGILEYPQYTRPSNFRGLKVPEVLLSGNHKEIERWRKSMARKITEERRPELINKIRE